MSALKGFKKGLNSPPTKSPNVLAAMAFAFYLLAGLIFEYFLLVGREFLIVITLWMVLRVGAKYYLRFPEDHGK